MRLRVWGEPAVYTSDDDSTLYPLSENEEDHTPSGTFGWWGQYSAPGYMDRTETCGPFASPAEAARETFKVYGDDERGSEDRRELARVLWKIRGAK